jgi:hypothetical protein
MSRVALGTKEKSFISRSCFSSDEGKEEREVVGEAKRSSAIIDLL